MVTISINVTIMEHYKGDTITSEIISNILVCLQY